MSRLKEHQRNAKGSNISAIFEPVKRIQLIPIFETGQGIQPPSRFELEGSTKLLR